MKSKNKYKLSGLLLSLMGVTTVQAADKNFLGTSEFQTQSQTQSQWFNPATMSGLESMDSLTEKKNYLNADGSQTIRYQQMFRGIPVIGDDVIITRDRMNAFKSAHGVFVQGINADLASTSPRISKNKALSIAKGLTRQTASNLTENNFENETSRLAIWLDKNNKAQLVYEVSYFVSSDNPSRPYILVDAKTGRILFQFDNLQTAEASGPGGNGKTGRYEYGTDFSFLNVEQNGNTCKLQNSNVKSVNLNHGSSGSTAFSFNCFRNDFKEINGAYSPINDAHYFGNVVFNMYNDWINTAPLSFQLTMRVHYRSSYENAFWNGSSMTFGDGKDRFYPLVSLDVSAHEVSHGFTEQNSNLTYSGKSGGLNESFSDMAGEAAEFYMNATNDWMVGSQIFKGEGSLRYMDDPTKDGKSISHQSNFTSGMDVHHSSGVYNKAFYLLATTAGWDTRKAFEIYAKANQQYWSAGTNWDQAGVGVLDATCDLGYSIDDVQASLNAVGVNASPSNANCDDNPPPPPPVNELENGVAVNGLGASQGNDIRYTMQVPEGATNINFNISGGSGDADLYVKFGSTPTDSSYDCRPYKGGNDESCTGTNSGGTYYVRIKSYRTFANVSLVGSYEAPCDPCDPSDKIDEIYPNISLSSGEWQFYPVDLSSGFSDFTVAISGGSGDADLYVRQGSEPTTSSYECRPYKNGNNESCAFTNPAQNIWYVGLRGYSASSGLTLTIKANP